MVDEMIDKVSELQNVAQFIADSLEKMIMEGKLLPGSRLIQTEIAEQFGVSRLPVRDALKILEKREITLTIPRKGVIVRQVTVQEVKDLYELRLLLEGYAISVSLERIKAEDIDKAEKIIARQESIDQEEGFLELLDIDEQFHRILWSKCGNREIDRSLETLWNRLKLLRSCVRDLSNWKGVSVEGHRKIVAELKKKNFIETKKVLETAIIRARDEIIESLEKK
ncbi:GntR family transcriptional regulator [Sporomusa acidovorans]|uniref:HTH-type transcriptional regulator McbR n=1 Tax=Sporomusa acidovorans (strain ATCC 49682 / DSM 3132 / Mol) TaxID=1123286 RepID=A0ABZ3J2M1_SPOA4|nr:GntR family transcriptional regulator [Sporomusa acidovorans]OZC16545.1 HTH-type transcriptional regulator McbR [Sporomusa acidovorans DSM 3132]SDF61030.1 transcriptional regulator, GntR family [Sporomusa acidovorans]